MIYVKAKAAGSVGWRVRKCRFEPVLQRGTHYVRLKDSLRKTNLAQSCN